MTLATLTPRQAHDMQQQGALLVDIRERDEHARERIAGAFPWPVSAAQGALPHAGASAVVFHCRSGARTQSHAARLAAAVSCPAFVMEGGLDAWKRAGLPVRVDRRQPLELMRQVQIAAGSLVLLGVALGAWLSPAWYALPAFVGAGLVFAGASGFCGMARLLALMPWNRRAMR